MNGRCHKDALDRAEDICELCAHQFCATCLLFPRGHRNPPTCKTCALEHSGLRGGSTKRQAISKREYKKRKKELFEQLETVEEKAPAIEFFELNDPSKFDRSTELDRRIAVTEEEPAIDILAIGDEPPVPKSPVPNPAPVPEAQEPPPPTPPPPAPTPAARVAEAADHAVSGLAPVDTSVNPLALGGAPAPSAAPAASEPDNGSSAAELLARLKADQPIQSQFTAAPAGLDTDPFATSTSDLVAPQKDEITPVQLETPAPLASPTPTPTTSGGTVSEPWSPPSPPPRGSNLDAMSAESPTQPPAQQVQQAPAQQAPVLEAPLEENPFGASPFETSSPAEAADDETPKRRKADTDESGQWIPPSLRGMATPEERDPLPKRRSSTP